MKQNSVEVPSYEAREFKEKSSKYCVIIPVINEGERIQAQLVRMNAWMKEIDVIIVDGGSTDGSLTLEFLEPIGLKSLLIKTGAGKLSAQIRVGLSYALEQGYEGVILIDGNNKDNPEAIATFIKKLNEGFDHIQGSRFVKGGLMINNPASRVWAIRLIHAPLISIAARFWYTDTTNGFRAYSRRFLLDKRVQPFRDIFSKYELHYYLAIQAPRLAFKSIEIPVERKYPADGVIPTKIKGFSGNFAVLKTLFDACLGKFNPKENQ